METKEVSKALVLKYTTRATLKTLEQFVGVVPSKLQEKALELGIETGDAQIWQYIGSDGNPDTEFTLEICIPVKVRKEDTGEFQFAEIPEIRCISEIHKGAWNKLGVTYEKIMKEMSQKSLCPTGICREIYITCDFENQQNNITEVQVAF